MIRKLFLGLSLALLLVAGGFSSAQAGYGLNTGGCQFLSLGYLGPVSCVSSGCVPQDMKMATAHEPAHHAWIDK